MTTRCREHDATFILKHERERLLSLRWAWSEFKFERPAYANERPPYEASLILTITITLIITLTGGRKIAWSRSNYPSVRTENIIYVIDHLSVDESRITAADAFTSVARQSRSPDLAVAARWARISTTSLNHVVITVLDSLQELYLSTSLKSNFSKVVIISQVSQMSVLTPLIPIAMQTVWNT